VDLAKVIRQCEDYLFVAKAFSVQERILYYHLLRQSRVDDKEQVLVALLPLAKALGVAESTVRECIRSLNERGCLQIVDRSRQGHLVRVSLPDEIPGVVPEPSEQIEVKVEELDFFNGRRFLAALLAREHGKCFYCFKSITAGTCELDHVQSRINGSDHGYRNIVAACHDCNTTKQEAAAQDFLRSLYRKGKLSEAELAERLQALEALAAGKLQPSMELVRGAI
jgi:Zn-finger protein